VSEKKRGTLPHKVFTMLSQSRAQPRRETTITPSIKRDTLRRELRNGGEETPGGAARWVRQNLEGGPEKCCRPRDQLKLQSKPRGYR